MIYAIYIGSKTDNIAHLKTFWDERIAVVDNSKKALDLLTTGYNNYDIVFYEKNSRKTDIPIISDLKSKSNAYLVLVTDKLEKEDILSYLRAGVNTTILPQVRQSEISQMIDYIKRNKEVMNSQKIETRSLKVYRMPLTKRIFDIVMSVLALIVLMPLFLIVALCIRFESKGPIIYKSKRVGSNYKIFDFLKFRSMYVDADARLKEYKTLNQYKEKGKTEEEDTLTGDENADVMLVSDDFVISENEYINKKHNAQENAFIKYEHDPRITKVGRILRKYSIDELPQLINILKKDMSFVGNRPLPLYEAELLTSDQYIDRFIAPAGLTGLWQVEKRGGSKTMSAEERKQLDIYYAQNSSLLLDAKIIVKTFSNFIQKEDV